MDAADDLESANAVAVAAPWTPISDPKVPASWAKGRRRARRRARDSTRSARPRDARATARALAAGRPRRLARRTAKLRGAPVEAAVARRGAHAHRSRPSSRAPRRLVHPTRERKPRGDAVAGRRLRRRARFGRPRPREAAALAGSRLDDTPVTNARAQAGCRRNAGEVFVAAAPTPPPKPPREGVGASAFVSAVRSPMRGDNAAARRRPGSTATGIDDDG